MTVTDTDLDDLCAKLEQRLQGSSKLATVSQTAVDAPFDFTIETAYLFLGFLCLYLVKNNTLYLAAWSDNEYYEHSVEGYNFDPKTYRIALDNPSNSIAQALREGKPIATENWDSLSRPEAKEGAARLNQANAGIAYSVVYPLGGKTQGAILYNYFQYQDSIGALQWEFMKCYTTVVAEQLDKTK